MAPKVIFMELPDIIEEIVLPNIIIRNVSFNIKS